MVCQLIGITHSYASDYLLSYSIDPTYIRECVDEVQRLTKQVVEQLHLIKEPQPVAA